MLSKGATVIVYPASDLASTKALFTRLLGAEPDYDDAYYVGWQLADQHIGLDPNGAKRGMTGATPFFEVDDIRATLAALLEAGGTQIEDAHVAATGLLIAMVKDADGNMIGLSQSSQA
jgi:predicted enzyme related to lactoylglutathione lyase